MQSLVNEPLEVAAEFSIENTKIKIANDYCNGKTTKEIEDILEQVSKIVINDIESLT